MRVLVLGASADQGVPLVRALLAAGHQVTAGARRADAIWPDDWAILNTIAAIELRFLTDEAERG